MNQAEFLPLLNILVAVLLSGNLFFIKKLIDKIEKTMEGVQDLKIKVALHDLQLKGKNLKDSCNNERKEK